MFEPIINKTEYLDNLLVTDLYASYLQKYQSGEYTYYILGNYIYITKGWDFSILELTSLRDSYDLTKLTFETNPVVRGGVRNNLITQKDNKHNDKYYYEYMKYKTKYMNLKNKYN